MADDARATWGGGGRGSGGRGGGGVGSRSVRCPGGHRGQAPGGSGTGTVRGGRPAVPAGRGWGQAARARCGWHDGIRLYRTDRGKGLRDLRPDRSRTRHEGQGGRSADPRDLARGQGRDDAGWRGPEDGPRHRASGDLSRPVRGTPSVRLHPDTDTAGRQAGQEASALPQVRRRGRARHRGSGHAAAGIACRLKRVAAGICPGGPTTGEKP